jgi:hypothetical protein
MVFSYSFGPLVVGTMSFLINDLLLVGLLGMCIWWWEEGQTGLLGATGFVIGFAGATMALARGIYTVFSTSGVVDVAPWYVYVRAGTGLPAEMFRWLPLLPIGLVTVGIGCIVTGALRGWWWLPLTMGLFGYAYHLTDSGGVFEMGAAHVLFGALFSFGWLGLGCLLWSKGPERHADTLRA